MYDDCDMPEFYDESEHIARKHHRCAECNTAIRPGEKYLTCRGKWHGEFQVFKQHLICLKACLEGRNYMQDQCVPFGSLLEWYGEYEASERKELWPKELRSAMAKVLWHRRRNIICGERTERRPSYVGQAI